VHAAFVISIKLAGRWSGRRVGKSDSVKTFPVFRRHHLDRIPRTTVEKRPVRAFTDALLTTDAEIWVNFDASEGWVIFVGHPEHTRLNGTILDTGR
jgi:hypothetical protein